METIEQRPLLSRKVKAWTKAHIIHGVMTVACKVDSMVANLCIEVVESEELEEQQHSVVLDNALLHQWAGRVKPTERSPTATNYRSQTNKTSGALCVWTRHACKPR